MHLVIQQSHLYEGCTYTSMCLCHYQVPQCRFDTQIIFIASELQEHVLSYKATLWNIPMYMYDEVCVHYKHAHV